MKLIKEQEEEWVKISPQEYIELMQYASYNAKGVSRLPKFRNKKIWITGNLDLSGVKELTSLDGVGYIEGNLNISHTGVSDVSSINLKGYVIDYGSRLDQIRKKRIRDKKISESQDRRDFDEWDLNNDDIDDVGFAANAIFEFISGRHYDIVREKDDDQKLRSHEIQLEKLLEKEKQYEEEGKDLTEVHSDIEVQQDIIEELNLKIDVYNLVPEKYGWRGLTSFEFISNNPTAPNGHVYAAATWDEVDKACREVLDEHLQSPRQYFKEDFLRNYIDEQEVASYFESFYEDDIRESPESYFDDSDYELTDEQEKMIDSLQKQIDDLEWEKNEVDEGSDEYKDIQEKIDELQEQMDEIVPDTSEPTEDMISDKVEEMVRDVRRNPTRYMDEFDMDIEYYIDKNAIIEDVINSDGPGAILGSYDGDYDTEKINDETYYIFRGD